MSSTSVERQIVQMVFEAKDFRKGIRESIEDLGNFKKSFDLSKAQESFGELEKASRVDFGNMASSLESINAKMGGLGVAAAAMITKITQSVMDGVKKMWNALVMTPIKTGLEEYETQLNAVQTILANTKKHGTTLKDVSGALDELNLYADLTIYNFTQMTDSIGKFTTAGVDLDTSVAAIKGIANVAALSGSNAQQASTAMYQLSQAISSGVVRLQDWISVENAGMGGTIFQDSLMETARVHGVAVDDMVDKTGSFRASLAERWLTDDIMLETLSKFTGDMTAAQLEQLGYTEEQIAGIIETATLASDAATKIKTFTQLMETMNEALQSGWSQSWAIMFGDFEEAKEMWGEVGTFFGDIIAESAEARNNMLQLWKDTGGRTVAIMSFFNIIESLAVVLDAFKEAISDIFAPLTAADLSKITLMVYKFSESFKAGTKNLDVFKSIIRGLAAAFDIVRLVIFAILTPLGKFIKTLAPTASSFFETAASIGDTIVAFREFAIKTNFFTAIVESIQSYISGLIDKIKDLRDSFLNLGVMKDVTKWFDSLERNDFIKMWDGIITVLQVVAGVFVAMALIANDFYKAILKLEVIQKLVGYFEGISWEGIKKSFTGLVDSVKDLIDSVKNSDILAKFIILIKTFDGRRFEQFLTDAKVSFSWIGDILDKITGKFGGLSTETVKTDSKFKDLTETIMTGLHSLLDFLIEAAGKIDYSKVFELINTGLLAGLLMSVRSFVSGGWLQDAIDSVFGRGSTFGKIGASITDAFGSLEGVLTAYQQNIKADTLQKIAISIALLAGSIALMTLIDSTKLLAATASIALMIGLLFGSAGALGLIKTQDAIKASVAIVGLSIAIAIAAVALKTVSTLSGEELESSLTAMAVGLVALVASVSALSMGGDKKVTKTILTLIGLGVALNVLTGVIRTFGEMKPAVLAQGIKAIGAALGLLVTSLLVMSKLGDKGLLTAAVAIVNMSFALDLLAKSVFVFGSMDIDVLTQGLEAIAKVLAGFAIFSRLANPTGMLSASIAIVIMSGALLIMVEVVKRFGAIQWEELERGLIGMAAALAILVIAANLMTGALAGAAAMLVMSFAVLALSVSLKLLSTLSWEELGIGLAAIAGAFVILGLAGLLLTPLIPLLMLLGVAILLIGAGAVLFGLGLLAAATGLVALAASGAAIAAAVGIVGAAIIEILPKIGTAIAEAFTNFLQTIADNTPKIIEATNTIILGMITSISELIPDIVTVMMDMVSALLTAIVERLPEMIQQGYDILLAFLQGIADNIADIIAAGLEIVTEIINGIAEGLPALIESAFNLIVVFLNGIADAIEENMDDILKAGKRIGDAIVDGLVGAIMGAVQRVIDAAKALAAAAVNAISGGVEEGSPSRATYRIGLNVVLGFINGIEDNLNQVRDVFSEFSRDAKKGLEPAMAAISQEFDKTVEFTPEIRPVLNLDDVTSGIGSMNRSLSNSTILAQLAYGGQRATGEDGARTGTSGADGGVQFIQNNYSPKALDRETIYRQTKTQVAQLALRAATA